MEDGGGVVPVETAGRVEGEGAAGEGEGRRAGEEEDRSRREGLGGEWRAALSGLSDRLSILVGGTSRCRVRNRPSFSRSPPRSCFPSCTSSPRPLYRRRTSERLSHRAMPAPIRLPQEPSPLARSLASLRRVRGVSDLSKWSFASFRLAGLPLRIRPVRSTSALFPFVRLLTPFLLPHLPRTLLSRA